MNPVSIGIAAMVAAIVLWSRKSKADPGPVPPGPVPPGPVPPGPVPPGPVTPGPVTPGPLNPWPVKPEPKAGPGARGDDPIDVPEQGKWYRVKDGDSLSKISALAGLGGTAWRLIRDAAENSWLSQQYPDGRYFAGSSERALPLYRWFSSPGYMVQNQWRTAQGNVFPSIFIPVKK
jgi:hypothetical protein